MATIDILTYQLKYKNDAHVLDLLRAYDDCTIELSDKLYTQDDIDTAEQSGRDMIKKDIEDYADDIDDILDDLQEGNDDDKKSALSRLEKLVERMRF